MRIIRTRSKRSAIASCTLEWAEPEVVKRRGQGRGNSGVFLMSRYEVQVLDSYNNKTYLRRPVRRDLQAIRRRWSMCRANRASGSRTTLFSKRHDLTRMARSAKPAYVTVLQNGVLVQNHIEIEGTTSYDSNRPAYEPHPDEGAAATARPRQSRQVPQHLDSRNHADELQDAGGDGEGGKSAGRLEIVAASFALPSGGLRIAAKRRFSMDGLVGFRAVL